MKPTGQALGVLALGIALMLVAVAVYHAEGQQRDKEEEPKSVKEALAAVPKAVAERERLGRVLLAGLSDEKRPAKQRVDCALALGKLRHAPAIPKLIELINLDNELRGDFHGKEIVTELPPFLDMFPSTRALVDYGVLALPALAEAYVTEDDEGHTLSLACALLKDKEKRSKIYLQGLFMERPDRRSKLRVLKLVSELQYEEHEDGDYDERPGF